MTDEKTPPEFMSALVTEHFALQSSGADLTRQGGG
jgi:hypothetical protein